MLNLLFGWCWILAGLATGAIIGLFFHRADWMGGYGSWCRRMMRLGHIAFVGTGLLNILFSLSLPATVTPSALPSLASGSLIGGAITMPLVCFASALRKPMRHLFAIPVVLLSAGVALLVVVLLKGGN